MEKSSRRHWLEQVQPCPETVYIPLEQTGGYETLVTCSLARDHEELHLDSSGRMQWQITPAGIQYREELDAEEARRNSPEYAEKERQWHQNYQQRRADEAATAVSKYSKGKERIREWVEAGRGQLVWRDEEELKSVNGGGVVIKATAAHVWFGDETACGKARPKASSFHNKMPEAPVQICHTCAVGALRRRLPSVALE